VDVAKRVGRAGPNNSRSRRPRPQGRGGRLCL